MWRLLLMTLFVAAGCELAGTDLESATGQDAPSEAPADTPVGDAPSTDDPDPDASGARIWSVREAGFYLIRYESSGTEGWPRWTLSNGKVMNGYLYINGKSVDKVAVGAKVKGVENTQKGSQYYQPISKGQVVAIQLRSKDGSQRTNEEPFVWPWPGTDEVQFER